jgi:hypothetical protein
MTRRLDGAQAARLIAPAPPISPTLPLNMDLTADTVVVASPEQVSSELNGEVVVLNHRDGVYFGLDAGVGALVWRTLQTPRKVADIMASVMTAYDVEPDRCLRDVTGLLQELLGAGLIETRGDGG